MIWFIIYICGIVSFLLWDTFIGLSVEFDGYQQPPLVLAAAFWFITLPLLLVYRFIRFCNRVKDDRLKKQAAVRREQEKKRLAAND